MLAITYSWAKSRLDLLRSCRGEIKMGSIIGIVVLMVAYYRFPWIFEGFVNYALTALDNAIKSGGTPKPGPHTVPVTTTSPRG